MGREGECMVVISCGGHRRMAQCFKRVMNKRVWEGGDSEGLKHCGIVPFHLGESGVLNCSHCHQQGTAVLGSASPAK